MVDFSFIGKDGLIIQYEDIISMTGYNVANYFKSKKYEKLNRMSNEDILLRYLNRTIENIDVWLKEEFNIDFNISDCLDSNIVFHPNLSYAYRVFHTAYKNGIKNLIIHSNDKSDVIKNIVSRTFGVPIKYTYGDIVPVLKNNVNSTYLTSSSSNIMKCMNINTPIALTIVDDYMYIADIILKKIDDMLRAKNIYVCYTSILSAGFI